MPFKIIILYVMLLIMIACQPQSQSQDLLTEEYLTSAPTKT